MSGMWPFGAEPPDLFGRSTKHARAVGVRLVWSPTLRGIGRGESLADPTSLWESLNRLVSEVLTDPAWQPTQDDRAPRIVPTPGHTHELTGDDDGVDRGQLTAGESGWIADSAAPLTMPAAPGTVSPGTGSANGRAVAGVMDAGMRRPDQAQNTLQQNAAGLEQGRQSAGGPPGAPERLALEQLRLLGRVTMQRPTADVGDAPSDAVLEGTTDLRPAATKPGPVRRPRPPGDRAATRSYGPTPDVSPLTGDHQTAPLLRAGQPTIAETLPGSPHWQAVRPSLDQWDGEQAQAEGGPGTASLSHLAAAMTEACALNGEELLDDIVRSLGDAVTRLYGPGVVSWP